MESIKFGPELQFSSGLRSQPSYGNDIKVRAKAMAAAASDARMSGCELPVIINSGSGNQGITASFAINKNQLQ